MPAARAQSWRQRPPWTAPGAWVQVGGGGRSCFLQLSLAHCVALCWSGCGSRVAFSGGSCGQSAAAATWTRAGLQLSPSCCTLPCLCWSAGMAQQFGGPQASALPAFPPMPQASLAGVQAAQLCPTTILGSGMGRTQLQQHDPPNRPPLPALRLSCRRCGCAAPPLCCAWPPRLLSRLPPARLARQTPPPARAAAACTRHPAQQAALSLLRLLRSRLLLEGGWACKPAAQQESQQQNPQLCSHCLRRNTNPTHISPLCTASMHLPTTHASPRSFGGSRPPPPPPPSLALLLVPTRRLRRSHVQWPFPSPCVALPAALPCCFASTVGLCVVRLPSPMAVAPPGWPGKSTIPHPCPEHNPMQHTPKTNR